MKALSSVLIALLVFFFVYGSVSGQQRMEDVIHKKDGSVLRGVIVEQIPNESIKIKTRDGNVFFLKMEEIEQMEKVPIQTMVTKKSPTTAFLLSLLVVGVGQHYNGEHTKGIIQEVAWAGGFALGLSRIIAGETDAPLFVGFGLSFLMELWSLIDAPLSASRINRKIDESYYGHLLEFQDRNCVFGFDAVASQHSVGGKLTLHF